jgi:hypothetical protein
MRKLEGIVKEIVDEMGYLKAREERFTDTNSASSHFPTSLLRPPTLPLPNNALFSILCFVCQPQQTNAYKILPGLPFAPSLD